MLESLVPFVVQATKVPAEEFARNNPDPVFVVEPFTKGEASAIQTFSSGRATASHEQSTAKVKKREGANAFGMMVTLGRASNNDIQINCPAVSKFHAFVMFEPDGSPSLTDAGSTCGTWVAGQQLKARVDKVPLADGTKVRLGEVDLTYFSPTAFHTFLLNLE